MSATTLIAGVVFGAIGFSAFLYGKKQGQIRPLIIGIALMAYPYLITDVPATILIGVALTGALFLFKD